MKAFQLLDSLCVQAVAGAAVASQPLGLETRTIPMTSFGRRAWYGLRGFVGVLGSSHVVPKIGHAIAHVALYLSETASPLPERTVDTDAQ